MYNDNIKQKEIPIMKIQNIVLVTLTINSEFTVNVRVEANGFELPTHEKLREIISPYVSENYDELYTYTIDDVVPLSDALDGVIPYIGKIGRKDKKTKALKLVDAVGNEIHDLLEAEVKRLMNSGAVDSEDHNPSSVVAVALENIASKYANPSCPDYKNLQSF